MRWLLSTVPSSMIFDDHDVHDDWNTSKTWVTDIRAQGWWDDRIIGGFMSYWLYQHLGNLSPSELDENDVYARVREADDAGEILRDYAFKADREVEGTRWSYCRDIGPARLVMVDSRAGRVLDPGERSMVDEEEWQWIEEHAQRRLQAPADRDLAAVAARARGCTTSRPGTRRCATAPGGRSARTTGEKLRQGLDLEHWAAFGESLERMMGIVRAGRDRRARRAARLDRGAVGRRPPRLPRRGGLPARAPACARPPGRRRAHRSATRSTTRSGTVMRFMASAPARVIMRALARAAGVEDPPVRWRYAHDEPWFDNQVATLELDGRRARLVLEKTLPPEDAERPCWGSSRSSSAHSPDTHPALGTFPRKERTFGPLARLQT